MHLEDDLSGCPPCALLCITAALAFPADHVGNQAAEDFAPARLGIGQQRTDHLRVHAVADQLEVFVGRPGKRNR